MINDPEVLLIFIDVKKKSILQGLYFSVEGVLTFNINFN